MERLPSFHVQIQKPASRSPTLTAFVFLAKFAEFFNYKNLKQEVHDDLSVCADERSPCGLSIILSMSRDQKVMKLLTQWRKTYELLSRSCFYCPNLITAALLQLEIKRFVQVTCLYADDSTESFEWGLPDVQIWCF